MTDERNDPPPPNYRPIGEWEDWKARQERQPSAAAFQHWDKVREQDWNRPFAPSDWANAIMKAFDAGAAAERERECVYRWGERNLVGECGWVDAGGDATGPRCPYCGGTIVVKEER